MKLEERKKALTVFSDISLKELKQLLALESFPILVVNNSLKVIGILDEARFLNYLSAEGYEQPLSTYLDYSFCMVSTILDLSVEEIDRYNYFIVKNNEQHICYKALEVKNIQYQHELSRLLNVNESLRDELDLLMKKKKELIEIINSSYDEIYVTDANGNTLFVSEACKRFTGLPPEAFLNKNIKDLEDKGLIVNSVTLKTIKTKTVQYAEQVYPNGKTVFTTAKPIFDEEGKLYRIISNSRDISELVQMRNKLTQADSMINQQIYDDNISKKTIFYNRIITQSKKMITVIELAKRVAPIDSSIFIHGESGVGKGVLAKVIHELSPRKNKNFIKVNCGAIPPNLIESELFGYEAGAFTGANKNGKAGLVEMANGGTLFLDEIGEMPLDVQVKILHLVQEKTFTRVGGTKEKQVDIRIISATNRNLQEMIENKTFRQDLYYRLHVVPIRIPPLRREKKIFYY
ncbi:sigma 54-interacting transcriptional regulator [Bacillus sp. T3]|uniref:sigma 54-interacting transcriptional regulator n=1 Tax=Bacillus sp. T3 TaxID=467262 RepID=UPI002981ED51|nr:sigma 54-interacting transcriptional regulator [Bacillus sp. T3]